MGLMDFRHRTSGAAAARRFREDLESGMRATAAPHSTPGSFRQPTLLAGTVTVHGAFSGCPTRGNYAPRQRTLDIPDWGDLLPQFVGWWMLATCPGWWRSATDSERLAAADQLEVTGCVLRAPISPSRPSESLRISGGALVNSQASVFTVVMNAPALMKCQSGSPR